MKQKMTHNEKNIIHINNKDFNGLYATNKRYIEKLANNFCVGDVEVHKDLMQVGSIGLFKAYQAYNNRSVPFISYASFWIKKEMMSFLNNNLRTIRIPTHQLTPSHSQYNPDYPTNIPTISTNTPLHNNDDGNMIIEDLLASDISDDNSDYTELYYYFNKLSEKQQEALKLKFGFDTDENRTYKECGIILNETGQNVKLKVDKALSILKTKITKK